MKTFAKSVPSTASPPGASAGKQSVDHRHEDATNRADMTDATNDALDLGGG